MAIDLNVSSVQQLQLLQARDHFQPLFKPARWQLTLETPLNLTLLIVAIVGANDLPRRHRWNNPEQRLPHTLSASGSTPTPSAGL